MRIAFFDTHAFERPAFEAANEIHGHVLTYLEPALDGTTAPLAKGHDAVCAFVNDHLDAQVLRTLKDAGIRLIALRSAGFNNVDLSEARRLAMPVVRVPEYSPYAVAEHAMCLILALNRHIHRAYARVRELNFSLEGLTGFDIHGSTVGVIGTGKIGSVMTRILSGFGARIIAYDPHPNAALVKEYGVRYAPLNEIYALSDVITLHCPLTPQTRHMVDAAAFALMKPEVILVNTGRGALIDTGALIEALKYSRIGAAGLDVYEEEEGVFFHDLSNRVLKDDTLARLLTFTNVLITSHQGFLTREALRNIAATTLSNVTAFECGSPLLNEVLAGD